MTINNQITPRTVLTLKTSHFGQMIVDFFSIMPKDSGFHQSFIESFLE
jgi:hypothetical protein